MRTSFVAKLGIALLFIGGIILWNTWLLGFLNHGSAGYTQMSISELNVTGQPFSRFFTDTEWFSGLFLLLGSLILLYNFRKGAHFMLIALLIIAGIGGLTIFDATHPVDCNRYQDMACQLKWARGEVSAVQKAHGFESEATAYITVLLSVELVVWALHQKLSQVKKISWVEVGLILFVAITVISPLFVFASSDSIVVESLGQRLWNTMTSVLFVYVIYRINRIGRKPRQAHSHLKTRKAIA
jgi:hypothetical protein